MPLPQVVGLIEGDGTITVRRFGHDGVAKPRVTVAARDDDAGPFEAWRTIAEMAGRPLGRLRHLPEVRRNLWQVDDPRDLRILFEIIDGPYSVLPTTKALIGIASRAADLVGGTQPRALPIETAGRLTDLARNVRAIRTGPSIPMQPLAASMEGDDFFWWFSGLFAADGHLALRDRRGGFAPVAVLGQGLVNAEAIGAIAERLGFGELLRATAQTGPQRTWRVRQTDACMELAWILRTHPMPVSSPRRAQFTIWTDALAWRANGRAPSVPTGPRNAELADLYARIRSEKRYTGRRFLCSCLPADLAGRADDRCPTAPLSVLS